MVLTTQGVVVTGATRRSVGSCTRATLAWVPDAAKEEANSTPTTSLMFYTCWECSTEREGFADAAAALPQPSRPFVTVMLSTQTV